MTEDTARSDTIVVSDTVLQYTPFSQSYEFPLCTTWQVAQGQLISRQKRDHLGMQTTQGVVEIT